MRRRRGGGDDENPGEVLSYLCTLHHFVIEAHLERLTDDGSRVFTARPAEGTHKFTRARCDTEPAATLGHRSPLNGIRKCTNREICRDNLIQTVEFVKG